MLYCQHRSNKQHTFLVCVVSADSQSNITVSTIAIVDLPLKERGESDRLLSNIDAS